MTRVLHIVPHLRPGGAERIATHIMRSLDRERFDIVALSLAARSGSDLERMLEEDGVPVRYLDKPPGFHPATFWRVYRALSELRPQIVHSHGHVLRYALPALALRRPPAMIHTVHSLAEHEVEPRARMVQRLAFRLGVKPVAVSRAVAESLERLYGVEPPPVAPNCVPVSRYSRPRTPRAVWRVREGFGPDDVLITCVAQLRPEKRHAALLQAFAQGPASNPKARLVLAGRGALEESLRRQAGRLGVADRVRFLGVRWDVPDLLAASDVFVLASQYEGSPVCVLEAMSAGLPVVCTAVGGSIELVRHGSEGLTVPLEEDPTTLACAMQYLAENPVARRRMGAAGAQRAREVYDLPAMASAYERLYDDLLGGWKNGSAAGTASLRSRFGLEGRGFSGSSASGVNRS